MIRASLLLAACLAPAARAVDFDREVAPLLAQRCLDCHSGPSPKGKLDLSREKAARASLAAKLDDAALWQRVRDDEMPPKKPLSAPEKALLKRWIESGAKWGTDPIDPFRATTEHRAGYDWWSLRPVARPTPPTTKRLAHSPIDRFLLAKLEAKGLSFSPAADRRTLIRRVTFDLTGLPPTPDEIHSFLSDDRPDAYERLVDRLLSSPAYGERYARHWLDVVRYGESDGFERDLPRFSAWPYRDWVVRALNADMPYDEFARLQLAGDSLGDADGVAATGFLVAGAHDIVMPVSETMKASMRQDELEDLVGTVGQTFLGLTVHCARCHDHKFDPVPQRDYYRLVAALAGVGHGERSHSTERTQTRLAEQKKLALAARRRVAAIEEPVRRRLLAERGKVGGAAPEPLASWEFTRGLRDERGGQNAYLYGTAKLTPEGLLVDGKTGFAAAAPLPADLREKTLEAWVILADLNQRGGGVIGVQTLGEAGPFDSIVYGEQQPRRWMAGSEGFFRTRPLGGPEERAAGPVHVAVTYAADGTVTAYRDGAAYGTGYRADRYTFRARNAQVIFGMRHGPAGGNKMLAGTVVRARLYGRALTAEEVARSFGESAVRTDEILPKLGAADRAEHRKITDELRGLDAEAARLEAEVTRRIYAVNSRPVGATHLLLRGDVTKKAEPVAPGVLVALAGRVPEPSPADTDGARRAALARWVAHEGNPLFARVMANRAWQAHFGVGLVDTPSDFGFSGGRPSHPELLDWLAAEFAASGWSLKSLHRSIVTTEAYRQTSRPNPAAQKLDADNRLLWRKSPVRLEAEAVRDAVLAVSGSLDRELGGAPYLDFKTYFFKGTQFYDALDQIGPAFTRRSLYRMWARGGRNPLLDALDCPDPSAATPRRAVTTTPLQALAMFNNAFVLDQADRFAVRLRAEGSDAEAQVRRAYLLALGREPDNRELPLLRSFVERHGLEALGRVIFNTNEFVQVE